jgi:hypothetical protein
MGYLQLYRQGNFLHHLTYSDRQTDVRIAFRTNTPIGKLFTQNKPPPPPDKFSLSGVYKLTCPQCQKAYVGQTGRSFNIRYNEHKQAFRNNSHSPSFTKHLNEEAYSFGTIHNIMQVLQYHEKKGAHMNTIERFHIHAEFTANNHLNDDTYHIPQSNLWHPLKDPPAITSPHPPPQHRKWTYQNTPIRNTTSTKDKNSGHSTRNGTRTHTHTHTPTQTDNNQLYICD